MRRCDNCGVEIPLGSNYIEVRAIGFKHGNADFCSPECFEEFYAQKRYKLWEDTELELFLKKEKKRRVVSKYKPSRRGKG